MEYFENLDVDNFESQHFSHTQSQNMSTEARIQAVNKNIEDLKKLRKPKRSFGRIYCIFNRIERENDFHAMNFAVKEKFYEVKNKCSGTIVDYSIIKRNHQLVRLFIEFGVNSNYNSEEMSNYNYNEITQNYDFIRFIMKIQNFDVIEALNWASREGHLEVVKLLLTVPGIDVNAKGTFHWTALSCASADGHHDIVKFLLTVPGINVNAKNNENNTALIWASLNGHYEVVKLLLSFPGINVNAINKLNNTALIFASNSGHYEVVKQLLAAPGIDVNFKNNFNNTALICASNQGHHEVVKLLLAVPGIDVNAKDVDNKTALILASYRGHYEVVKLLLTVPGIDVNAKDNDNRTALYLASFYYHIVKILRDHGAN